MLSLLLQRKHHNFSRLWLAQLISQFGDRIHQLALVGLIAERDPGNAMGLAKLLAFTILPVFVVQPFAGVLVDRWDRRTTLFICDIARGILVIFIPLIFIYWHSIIPIYIIVFLVFCFSRFYVPAKLSLIPDVVPPAHLLVANSLMTVTGMIAFVIGCALGGFLIDHYGARNGFLIDAATYFISAMFLISMRLPGKLGEYRKHVATSGKQIVDHLRKSFWQELREGFIYLKEHKEIRFIINLLFVVFAAAGAVYVVIIVFIQQSFQSITRDLGILAVVLGAGLFAGALIYGRLGKRFLWHQTIFSCLIAGGLMLGFFAAAVHLYPNLVVASCLAAGLGLVLGPIFIAANTMVQLVSEEGKRGQVFSALEIITHLAFLLAMLSSSVLSRFVEEVWILSGVGVIFVGIGWMGLLKKQHYRSVS